MCVCTYVHKGDLPTRVLKALKICQHINNILLAIYSAVKLMSMQFPTLVIYANKTIVNLSLKRLLNDRLLVSLYKK